jgi:hypothetical protein
MKTLVLVVEGNLSTKKEIIRMLNAKGIVYIFMTTLEDAMTEFERNKDKITHIALDYTVVNKNGEIVNTSAFAETIATCPDFKGEVFPMSSDEEGNDTLTWILRNKCQSVISSTGLIKTDVINEIIGRVEKINSKV